jgi:drug/metabolite transporter (DMT)-like permease
MENRVCPQDGKALRAEHGFGVIGPSSSGERGNALTGILAMLVAGLCFAVMDSLVKYVSPRVPLLQIAFFRSLFAFPPILVVALREGGLAQLRTRRPGDHALRSLFGLASLYCFFYAFSHMPLADAVGISFAAPIFITALSVPLLGEPVGIRRWSAVLVGFLGVLVVVRPGSGVFQPAAVMALLATLFYALAMIFIRRLGSTEGTVAIAFHYSLTCAVLTALSLPFLWVTPGAVDAALLVTIGTIGGVGQVFVTTAFRRAPAAVVAPFDYMSILYVSIIGYAVWHDVPDRYLWVGAAILVASGLYILHRETRAPKAAEPVTH